jgi:hypothetical protein
MPGRIANRPSECAPIVSIVIFPPNVGCRSTTSRTHDAHENLDLGNEFLIERQDLFAGAAVVFPSGGEVPTLPAARVEMIILFVMKLKLLYHAGIVSSAPVRHPSPMRT